MPLDDHGFFFIEFSRDVSMLVAADRMTFGHLPIFNCQKWEVFIIFYNRMLIAICYWKLVPGRHSEIF